MQNPPKKEALTDLVSRFQGSNLKKQVLFSTLLKEEKIPAGVTSPAVIEAIKEILID